MFIIIIIINFLIIYNKNLINFSVANVRQKSSLFEKFRFLNYQIEFKFIFHFDEILLTSNVIVEEI